jgi:hypothetical protein
MQFLSGTIRQAGTRFHKYGEATLVQCEDFKRFFFEVFVVRFSSWAKQLLPPEELAQGSGPACAFPDS